MAPSQIWTRGKQRTVVKEGNALFNDAFNTLYLWLYGSRPDLDKKQWTVVKEGNILLKTHSTQYIYGYMAPGQIWTTSNGQWLKKEMFYLMMHSTHYIYGYMAPSQIWKRSNGQWSKEGNVLYNDIFNTLYLQLCGSGPDLDKKQRS